MKKNIAIKAKIDENNREIEFLMRPNQFTLNNAVSKLLQENQDFQKLCTHNFVDGYCEYCYAEEN